MVSFYLVLCGLVLLFKPLMDIRITFYIRQEV
nr:MAG TPA: hypothetical protein [Caudoviricetes sp.]